MIGITSTFKQTASNNKIQIKKDVRTLRGFTTNSLQSNQKMPRTIFYDIIMQIMYYRHKEITPLFRTCIHSWHMLQVVVNYCSFVLGLKYYNTRRSRTQKERKMSEQYLHEI